MFFQLVFFLGIEFKFSVVMATYNTKNYVKQAIESVINQTIGFENNIQLILINDGSDDGTEDILLNYKNLYPHNIILINQDNQGQACARNNGLKYVEGEYVNFLDSDDYLSQNAFEEVYEFFSLYHEDIDVVSLPLIQFGRTNVNHILNYKFENSRVIDLKKEPNNPQLHVASSFVKKSAINNISFPLNIVASEDSNFINKIILKKQKLGVLNSANYFYRKRVDYSSTLDVASSNIDYYNNRLQYHFLDLINYSISIFGFVPKFIQYTLIYDLYWLVNGANLDIFIDSDEKNDFFSTFDEILKFIDEDVIWNNRNFKYSLLKKFLYYYKVKNYSILPSNEVRFIVGDKQFDKLSYHSFWINNVEIRDESLYINGFLNTHFNLKSISVSLTKEDENGHINDYVANYIEKNNHVAFLSTIWQFNYNFEAYVPLDHVNSKIKLFVNYHIDNDPTNFDEKNVISHSLKVGFKDSSSISKECNYFISDLFLIAFQNKIFHILYNSCKGIIKF